MNQINEKQIQYLILRIEKDTIILESLQKDIDKHQTIVDEYYHNKEIEESFKYDYR